MLKFNDSLKFMPELPEVETIKNDLKVKITGKEINDAVILWKGVLNTADKKFIQLIKNAKISNISRRAKILIISLSNNYSLLIHLKMTGQLLHALRFTIYDLEKKLQDSKYKYARAVFFFKDNSALVFNDLRKFGYIKLISHDKLKEALNKEKYGPEPLKKEFTLEKFKEIIKNYPKKRIKQLLMEQSAIAGIGNIYADEICFYAKVLPAGFAGKLSNEQIKNLFLGIKKILSRAIELRGTSVENYVDASGRKGDYIKELKVYNREDKKCFRCKGIVKRIKLGGRSSYFCPICQK